jgi:hypothetical protein
MTLFYTLCIDFIPVWNAFFITNTVLHYTFCVTSCDILLRIAIALTPQHCFLDYLVCVCGYLRDRILSFSYDYYFGM